MLLGGNAEFVVEGVVPDLLHVVPVGDDTVLDRIFQGEDTSLALSLVAYVTVLLTHTDHHTLVSGPTYDRWEDGAGSVVSGETGLAHTGSIVDNKGCYFVVAHFAAFLPFFFL